MRKRTACYPESRRRRRSSRVTCSFRLSAGTGPAKYGLYTKRLLLCNRSLQMKTLLRCAKVAPNELSVYHCASAGFCLLVEPLNAHSATDTWTGGSAISDNWDDPANWSSAVPTTHANLLFGPANVRTTNLDDIANLIIDFNHLQPGGGRLHHSAR